MLYIIKTVRCHFSIQNTSSKILHLNNNILTKCHKDEALNAAKKYFILNILYFFIAFNTTTDVNKNKYILLREKYTVNSVRLPQTCRYLFDFTFTSFEVNKKKINI